MPLPFRLVESTAMFGFVRLCIEMLDKQEKIINASLLRKGMHGLKERCSSQKIFCDERGSTVIEVLVDRAVFPLNFEVEVVTNLGVHSVACGDLIEEERSRQSRSGLQGFLESTRDWKDAHRNSSPQVLDIGGRARSGYLLADHLPGCDVTVLDIRADEGVDIVADIHEMSDALAGRQFDFIICVSVFEHLVMPWKAALEINKVLRPDGIIFVQTHQTVGLHDRPWDYFRFSDDSWKGIFNAATGFEIISTMMTNFVRITPMHLYAIEPDSEKAGGFYESSVVARKVGDTAMTWPVPLSAIVDTCYPA